MAGRAEDAVEGVRGGGGADGEAEAGDVVAAEFFEGAVGVGFGVAGFVALVVGKPSERARRRRLGAPA